MRFGWINWVNIGAVGILIVLNLIAAKKALVSPLSSGSRLVNALEQAGRYGCMVLMILPLFAENWKFGFHSVAELLLWTALTALLLAAYALLWWTRSRGRGGNGVLYGLALLPVCLFAANGLLLRHPLLFLFALLFGAAHLRILREYLQKA